ncbi:MAG: hypothetical protein ACKVUT_14175 [Gaiella sp.]
MSDHALDGLPPIDVGRLANVYEALVAEHPESDRVLEVAARCPGTMGLYPTDHPDVWRMTITDVHAGVVVDVGTFHPDDIAPLDAEQLAAAAEQRIWFMESLAELGTMDEPGFPADVSIRFAGLASEVVAYLSAITQERYGEPISVADVRMFEERFRTDGMVDEATGCRRLVEYAVAGSGRDDADD